MRKLRKISCFILSGLFVFSACATGTNNSDEKVLRVVDANKPITLNHHDTSIIIDFNQIGQIMENLVEYDLNSKLVPAAAESWSESADHLTYTFKIRKKARWANGEPVTAHDFVFAWRTLATTPTSPYSSYVSVIKNGAKVHAGELAPETLGATAKDDHTLVVELEKPSALFLSYMAFTIFAPMNEQFYNEIGGHDAYGRSAATTLGNGAYTVEVFTPETEVVFVKNTHYWNSKKVDIGRVELRVVTEPSTQSILFESDEIDVLNATGILADQYKDYENLVPYMEASNQYMYLSNDTQKPMPALESKNFRLAVAHAIDKTILTDQIKKDNSKPLDSLIPEKFGAVGDVFYSDVAAKSNREIPTFNVAKAQEYLEAAKTDLGDTPLEFSLNFSDNATNKLLFENIKSQVETNLPGVTLNLNYTPSQLFYPEVKAFEVPAAAAGWGADFFDYSTFFVVMEPDGKYNYGCYNNSEIGKLLAEAESEPAVSNPEKRAELYIKAETLALQDGRIVPLMQSGANYAVKPNVKNYQRNALYPNVAYKYVQKDA